MNKKEENKKEDFKNNNNKDSQVNQKHNPQSYEKGKFIQRVWPTDSEKKKGPKI